jgi:hypothetical protein
MDTDTMINVWRTMRVDDLYANPALLAQALAEIDGGDLEPPLVALLTALGTLGKEGDSFLDNIVLQHEAAVKTIDELVSRVIEAEEKRGCWRSLDCEP